MSTDMWLSPGLVQDPVYHRPAGLEQALALLAEHGAAAVVIAGGTDVMIQVRRGRLTPDHLVHVGSLPELRRIDVGESIHIGAAVTHRELLASLLVPPLLQASAHRLGYRQTQQAGTVGGNLASAGPADLGAALLVHDAQIQLASVGGKHRMRVEDFVLGEGRTARRSDELITSIHLAAPVPGERTAYRKVGRRGEMDAPIVAVAARAIPVSPPDLESQGWRIRLAVGAYAPVPFRAVRSETVLAVLGEPLPRLGALGPLIAEAASAAGEIEPADDVRATSRYRSQLLPRVVAAVLTDLLSPVGTDQRGAER
ncbi:MAG: FAD binding domain-containing protein [Nocardioidaceae bacterium]